MVCPWNSRLAALGQGWTGIEKSPARKHRFRRVGRISFENTFMMARVFVNW